MKWLTSQTGAETPINNVSGQANSARRWGSRPVRLGFLQQSQKQKSPALAGRSFTSTSFHIQQFAFRNLPGGAEGTRTLDLLRDRQAL